MYNKALSLYFIPTFEQFPIPARYLVHVNIIYDINVCYYFYSLWSHFSKVILAIKEVITSTFKVIPATTKVILAAYEVIIATLNVISATTKVILATEEVTTATLKVISDSAATKMILATNNLMSVIKK